MCLGVFVCGCCNFVLFCFFVVFFLILVLGDEVIPGEKEFVEEATTAGSYMYPLPHVWYLVIKLIVFYVLER